MGHVYKWLGSDEQVKQLWQNREALAKYLDRLKELMEKDDEGEIKSAKTKSVVDEEIKPS